jgi:predicted MFS family arabinose efflux permease
LVYGVFFIAIFSGSALASLLLILVMNVGWRKTYFIIGGVGITVTLAFGMLLPNDPILLKVKRNDKNFCKGFS